MDLVNRLRQYIESTGMSSTQFADAAGITRPTLSQILTGRNKKISNELLTKLHSAFPDLDIMWLLFGGDNETMFGVRSDSRSENGSDAGAVTGNFVHENLKASNIDNIRSNLLSDRALSDDEIESFASDFFPERDRKNNIYQKPMQTNDSDSRRHSQSMKKTPDESTSTGRGSAEAALKTSGVPEGRRRIVAITVFYDDNTYETLSI